MRPTPALTSEILSYLLRNPAAEDTLEGIVEWWLVEERLFQATHQVRGALATLHEQGFVSSRTLADGRVLYRLDPERESDAKAALSQLQVPAAQS